MGYSSSIALEEEQARVYEQAYIQEEQNDELNKLIPSMFGSRIVKLSRKEAKTKHLYKRFNGRLRLA